MTIPSVDRPSWPPIFSFRNQSDKSPRKGVVEMAVRVGGDERKERFISESMPAVAFSQGLRNTALIQPMDHVPASSRIMTPHGEVS